MSAFRTSGRSASGLSSLSGRPFPIRRLIARFAERLAGELKALGVQLDDDLYFICRSGSRSMAAARAMAAAGYRSLSQRRKRLRRTARRREASRDRCRLEGGRSSLAARLGARPAVGTVMTVRVDLVDCSSVRRAVRNGANEKNGKEQEPWHSKSSARQATLGRGSKAGYARNWEKTYSPVGSEGSSSTRSTRRSSTSPWPRASSATGLGRIITTSCSDLARAEWPAVERVEFRVRQPHFGNDGANEQQRQKRVATPVLAAAPEARAAADAAAHRLWRL